MSRKERKEHKEGKIMYTTNCPKCKSTNITEGTAETWHCEVCDFSWLPYNTAPRFTDGGVKKSAPGSSVGLVVLMVLVVLIAIALGMVSFLVAVLVAVVGLLGGILYYMAKLSGGKS